MNTDEYIFDLSIVIVSWNVRDYLKACIESIYKHTKGINFEVIVVDNASSDGSVNMVRKFFPEVEIITNKYNAGFSKANNQAIKVSKGKYIATVNPDTLLIEDIFNPMISFLEMHNDIGIIGPKILNADRESIQYVCARKFPNPYFDLIDNLKLDRVFPRLFSGIYIANWDHKTSRYIELLSGACMMIRRKAIDDIGLFDENQFMYADDIDFCKRMIKFGWKIYYYADVSLIHYGGESSKKIKAFTNIKMLESKNYYYLKHHGKIYSLTFCLLIMFLNMGKYVWRKILRDRKEQVIELLEIYKTTIAWSIKEISRIYKKRNAYEPR